MCGHLERAAQPFAPTLVLRGKCGLQGTSALDSYEGRKQPRESLLTPEDTRFCVSGRLGTQDKRTETTEYCVFVYQVSH